MAVTGAAMVLSTLPGASAGLSSALASAPLTNTTRAGCELAAVGPMRARSQAWRSTSSGTARSRKREWVRACRNS